MTDLRHDPLNGKWVIIAPARLRRPLAQPPEPTVRGFCPLCPGQESATPAPILEQQDSLPGAARWSCRVVPSPIPALRVEGNPEFEAVGVYDRMTGIGAHEVVVETPEHGLHTADMDYRSVERTLRVYQERQQDLFRDGRLEYVSIVKNYRLPVTGGLNHAHSQLIATPFTPPRIAHRLEASLDHFQRRGRCLCCDMIRQELDSGQRLVWADSSWVVIAPFASRVPFQLTILPRRHSASLGDTTPEEMAGLARVLRDCLRRLKKGLDDPPYHMVLHTNPNPRTLRPQPAHWARLPWAAHWSIEIRPQLMATGAFESSTGIDINPVPPEEAATFLKELEI